jgi:hypothetical protein
MQYMYSSTEGSEIVLGFERNNAGLKKLPQVLSEQTSDSSAFLNAMCLLKYCGIFAQGKNCDTSRRSHC